MKLSEQEIKDLNNVIAEKKANDTTLQTALADHKLSSKYIQHEEWKIWEAIRSRLGLDPDKGYTLDKDFNVMEIEEKKDEV